MSALSFYLPYRHVVAGVGRVVLSVLAVMLGVALVVAIQLMNRSVLQSFLDTVDGVAGRAALSVVGSEGASFPEELVASVAAAEGVKLAVPLVAGVAFPDDGSGELLRVHGVDLTQDAAVRLYRSADDATEVIADPLVFLSQPDSIVLGREFAERRNLADGATIALVTPTGVKEFTIRGLLSPDGLARVLGGRLVVMDLYAAERAFTRDGYINQIDLVLAEGAELARTKAAVAALLPAGLTVEEPALRKELIRRSVGGFQAMLTAFGLLAVVAGFVICYSRLGAIFEARTWEVGLLRAVGLRRSVVFGELLKESLLLGLAGTVLGVPLGVLIGRYGLPFVATATALNFHMPVPSTVAAVGAGSLLAGVAVGLGAAALAAVVPALRLARRQPVAALTMRGREMPGAVRSGWALRVGLLAAIVGLVVWQHVARVPALGHLTTALLALVAATLARTLVDRGGRLLGPAWEGMFGPTGRMAAVHLRQVRRASLTVGTLGLGLGVVLMFGMLGWSFERTLVSRVASRLRADLVITSAFVSGGWMSAPLEGELVNALRTVPGVDVAVGEQRKDVPYHSGEAVLDAYDAACFSDARVCRWPLEAGALRDALDSVRAGEGVIVSSSFAYRFQTRPGDALQIESPNGAQRFRVVGVTGAEATSAVIMNRDVYRRIWNDDFVTRVHVVLTPATDRAAAETAIAQRLGRRYRLQIRSGAELIAYFAAQARRAFSLLYLMEAITFLLVVIGVGDTLASAVVERTREFGMMRAVGLRRSRLFGMVTLEGATIGLLGLVLALVAGAALGAFWVEVQFPAILGWQLELHFPGLFTLSAGTLAILLCLLASLTPSLKAARLPVPAALRNE